MATIGALDVPLTLNTAAFTAGTARARADLRSFQTQTNTALATMDRAFTRTSASAATLLARYARWGIILGTLNRAMRTAAETNTDAARSMAALQRAWDAWAQNAATVLTPVLNVTARILSNVAAINQQLLEGNASGAWRTFSEATSVAPTPELTERMRRIGVIPSNAEPRTGGIPFMSAMNIPDSIAVTPARTSALADLTAGDAMINAGLRSFTSTYDTGIQARLAAERAERGRLYQEGRALQDQASRAQQEALDEQAAAIADFHDRANAAWDDYWQRQAEAAQASADAAKAALMDFGSAAVMAFMRGGDAIGYFLDQLAATIIQTQILKPIIEGLNLGGGGFLASGAQFLLGGGFGFGGGYNAAADLYRASGGPVSAGRGYIVGEDGPEYFMPSSSGHIVPNGAMGGITVNVDARGSSLSRADVEVAVMRGVEAAVGISVGAVSKRQRNTGRRV